MSDRANHARESNQPLGIEVQIDVLAARCQLSMPAQRDWLLTAGARLFVATGTSECSLGDFLTAIAEDKYPSLLVDLMSTLQSMAADSPTIRPEIPDQWGRPLGTSWQGAEGELVATTPLKELPAEFKLSADFPEPIKYDPERKQLLYRGYMYKSSFDFLRSLHNGSAYQHALEELYRSSSQAWLTKGKAVQDDSLLQWLRNKLGLG